ncbi:MAG: hypothetical protein KDA22_15420 [Phycisphaerales bacterium]|nr:hypothetical protein [Phycisphaerales bacterium]
MRFGRLTWSFVLAAVPVAVAGCQLPGLVSNLGYAIEKEKKIEVLAQYPGLENQTVAIVVQADMSTLYDSPMVVPNVTANLGVRLQSNVPGIKVRDAREVMAWQYHTPGWSTMPYGDIARELDVSRVLIVDLYEFRLNPPGNRWTWDGVCAANVGVIERDGIDPDAFAETFNIVVRFPPQELGRDSATAGQIETGLIVKFIEKTAWLFYKHIEQKYPDG